jgi:hypothetical protein
MLEIVQDYEHLARTEPDSQSVEAWLFATLFDLEHLVDGGGDESRIADWRQRHEDRTVGDAGRPIASNLDGEPGFADATGAGERQQASARKTSRNGLHIPLTPDQGRNGGGQTDGGCWTTVRREWSDELRASGWTRHGEESLLVKIGMRKRVNRAAPLRTCRYSSCAT